MNIFAKQITVDVMESGGFLPQPPERVALLSDEAQRVILKYVKDTAYHLIQPPNQAYVPDKEPHPAYEILVTSRLIANYTEPNDVALGKDPLARRSSAFYSGMQVGYLIGKRAFPEVTSIKGTLSSLAANIQLQLDGLSPDELFRIHQAAAQQIRDVGGYGLTRVDCARALADVASEMLVRDDINLQIDAKYGIGYGVYVYYSADQRRLINDLIEMQGEISAIIEHPEGWQEIEEYIHSQDKQ